LFKFFRKSDDKSGADKTPRETGARTTRHSGGFKEFMRSLSGREELTVLDIGPTSAGNISLLTERGFSVRMEDLVTAAADPDLQITAEDGSKTLDVDRFLKENLVFRGQIFDAVFFWDVADYLPEALVKPVIEKICTAMKPGGVLLAFFHTKDAGPNASYSRYHIAGADALDLQPLMIRNGSGGPSLVKLQRVFNNRHIENLFRDFSSLKFFLARDNIREVLVVR
jgi:SAM-dependent methyltransferase